MTPDRFEQLVDAYGADINRWPQGEHASAHALAANNAALSSLLADASGLDDLLMAHQVEPASLALQMRMQATVPGVAVDTGKDWFRRASVWWSGLGLAGIGAAGVAAGVMAVSMTMPAAAPLALENGWTDSASAFATMATEAGEE